MWSTKPGHQVKVVKYQNEVNDENRETNKTYLYRRFHVKCGSADYRTGLKEHHVYH